MVKQSSILLVSSNPELHRTLELIASTCNSRFLGAENAKIGVGIVDSGKPDCVIFDLETLHNPKHKSVVKKRLEESRLPTLLLNDNENGVQRPGGKNTPVKLEPIVKFIMDTTERSRRKNGGILRRVLSFCGLR